MSVFFSIPPHVHIDFMVPPPGCGRSVTDFWVWGAQRAQLRCPDDVSDDIHIWAWSIRRSLKPNFYKLPRPGSLWGSSSAREKPHGRTANRARDLMVSSLKFWSPSHEAGQTNQCCLGKWFCYCDYDIEHVTTLFKTQCKGFGVKRLGTYSNP
jgi:hypothetical protein